LRAVVAVCATTDRFADDIHFKGGCLMGRNFGWGAVMQSYAARPPDPALMHGWPAEWLARLQADRHLAPLWAGHQDRGAYWRHGSVCEAWSAIAVPVQVWGGWMDGYINTVSELVENLKVPVQGVIGPWVHQYPHQAVPGPAIGFLTCALRWWDRWLKGSENGAEGDPAMRFYLREAAAPDPCMALMPGEWVGCGWPVARAQTLHLAGGALADAPGPVGRTIASPQHVGMAAGEYFPMGLGAEMPGDQRGDDALSVCFDGAVLEAPLVAADRPLAFLVARVNAVLPDGTSMRIAHGMLNLCHRDSRADPVPMVPGQAVDVALTLDLAAVRLAPGMRLRLALSNAYWPFLWPSPEAAAVTVTAGRLTLPVADPGALAPWDPPPPEVSHPAANDAHRRVEEDPATGARTLIITDGDDGWTDHGNGWRTRALSVERWTIRPDAPLSAQAEIRWHQQFARGGWHTETEAVSRITCTADHLIFHASTTARENGAIIHEDHDERHVPRRSV
jgi:predicted acyl esterase